MTEAIRSVTCRVIDLSGSLFFFWVNFVKQRNAYFLLGVKLKKKKKKN